MRKVIFFILFFGSIYILKGQKPEEQGILNTFNCQKDVVFKTVNGENVKMLIFYPKQDKIKSQNPWMLYVHGGGWAGGSIYNIFNKHTMRTLQTLLDSGIVVVAVDYRLAKTPVTAYEGVVDCKDATRFLLKYADKYKLDKENYGTWGGSAGGHLCLLTALGADSDFRGETQLAGITTKFKCVVSYFPFTSCLKPELLPGSIFEDKKLFVRLLGDSLSAKQELAKLLSPTEFLTPKSPPILLIHGDNDKTLPIINSTYMMEVAKKKKADVKLLTIKNAGHSFSGSNISPSMEDLNDYSAKFILSHLKVANDKANNPRIFANKSKVTYLNSDGTKFVSKSRYPKFSWDTTPMYYHFGDIDRVLKPEEEAYIADKTNFITIEKSHGFRLLGDAVLGTQYEATAFHKINPEIKVLYYFNSLVAWPFTQFNKAFNEDSIAKNPELAKFLLVDIRTGELVKKSDGPELAFNFDALNPEFRKWWIDSVVKGVEISGCDGVFIDRMNGGAEYSFRDDKAAEVQKAKGEMMAGVRTKMGADKLLIGNNAANNPDVFPSCDAFMFEHYNATVTTKEHLLKEWGDMLRIAKAGKITVYRFGVKTPGTRLAKADRETRNAEMPKLSQEWAEYFLACYLIGAQPYSYFQYNFGWNLSDGNLVDYPEFKKPLGSPKAAFKRVTPEGWQFTREFEHASVWVDTDKHEAKIIWK